MTAVHPFLLRLVAWAVLVMLDAEAQEICTTDVECRNFGDTTATCDAATSSCVCRQVVAASLRGIVGWAQGLTRAFHRAGQVPRSIQPSPSPHFPRLSCASSPDAARCTAAPRRRSSAGCSASRTASARRTTTAGSRATRRPNASAHGASVPRWGTAGHTAGSQGTAWRTPIAGSTATRRPDASQIRSAARACAPALSWSTAGRTGTSS